ncbi:MAG TPA: SIS domain-containing protein [Candidatus Brocadiia bacterium]|nr:SIS domain-containing protein [Candidatus Brocadiia bacterium]
MNIRERIQDVLTREGKAILSVRVTDDFVAAVETLKACKGKVLTTGMGKAGLVARKLASTLCSTGTPATFLHPGEAAHGDLGVTAPGDCLVAFSTSGKTREVIEVIKLARGLRLGKVIGITSHPDSEIRGLADILVDMGVIEEPCPLGLTPSASTAVMLAIGDALALALLEAKGVTREMYGQRHHGGYLGHKARTGNV